MLRAMSKPEDDRELPADDEFESDDEDAPSPTPFDHPLFLPALFVAFALWFGFDGWFNPNIEAVQFNRIMFVVWVVGAIWFGRKGWLELKQQRASAPPDRTGERGDPID